MMNLVKNFDNVILTKFLNRVWRRYGFYSNLGELFLDVKDFKRFNPDFDPDDDANFLKRLATEDDDEDENHNEDDENNEDKDGGSADTDKGETNDTKKPVKKTGK